MSLQGSASQQHHLQGHNMKTNIPPKDLKRKSNAMNRPGCYQLQDADTLDCPICRIVLSGRVYQEGFCCVTQCENGHSICSECCKKVKQCPSCSKPVGHIRNRAIEKILESLEVSCENASYDCKAMLKLHQREEHECKFRPFLCPVPECLQDVSTFTLPSHLKDLHHVRAVESNMSTGALCISMDPNESFVMVQTVNTELFLLHRRQAILGQQIGDAFFCTSFEAYKRCYDLKVTHSRSARVHSMSCVPAYNIRDWVENVCNGDTIFFSRNDNITPAYDVVLEDFNCFYDSESDRE